MNEDISASRPWQTYHTVFTNAKAGMDGVDKEKVQRIVYEMSKGSKFFQNEERKEGFIKRKIENMRTQCENLSATDLSHFQKVADKKMAELEASRDLSKTWLHVDMDAFYAAVETLDNPSLKGNPMAVGSMSMISTANYEARKFGIRAAMPGFIARKLCPELIFVPPDFKKYTHYSGLTRKVFHKYDPNFIASSLDEAYLNITEICKERDLSSEEIASELRTSVYEETGLTCSAGVAPNRMIAKVCSDINKPNGHFVLPNDRMAVMTFISSLPTRKIGGIGKVTEHLLRDALGISTCEEILQKSAYLCALFSHSSIDFFLSVGLGLGQTDTPEVRSRKGISCERTFSATDNEAFLYNKIAEIAESLSNDMKKESLCGRTLTLKLKTASFEVRTRAVSLQKYIFSSEDILHYASNLLKAELPLSLRLTGVRMSHFDGDKFLSDPTQKTLTNFIKSENTCVKDNCDTSSIGSGSVISDREFDGHLSDVDQEYGVLGLGKRVGYPRVRLDPNRKYSTRYKSTLKRSLKNGPESTRAHPYGVPSNSNLIRGSYSDDCNTLSTKAIESGDDGKELILWMDDYKCSFCGAELPPCFVEERREHSDYHFSEMLQREESQHSSREIVQQRRSIEKTHISKKNGRKKQKTSPKESKHIPIDLFFVKNNQNF
ncbi:DNA-directed DNA polymerase [Ranunculus cassubicifolius]